MLGESHPKILTDPLPVVSSSHPVGAQLPLIESFVMKQLAEDFVFLREAGEYTTVQLTVSCAVIIKTEVA